MINFFSKFLLFFGIFFNNFNINAQETKNIHMLLDKGLVVIETFPEKAPQTVKEFRSSQMRDFMMD